MVAACALLALCFVPGISVEIYGSKRWVQLPVLGQFQVSEMAKLVVVIALAAWYARWQTEVHTFWRGFVLPGVRLGGEEARIDRVAAEPTFTGPRITYPAGRAATVSMLRAMTAPTRLTMDSTASDRRPTDPVRR